MSSNEHAEGSAEHDPLECLLDAFVYAPIGLLLDGKELVPDLARRGRAQAANARVIGTFALSAADGRVQTAFADLERQFGVLLRTLAGSDPTPDAAAPTATEAPGQEPQSKPEPKSKPESKLKPKPKPKPTKPTSTKVSSAKSAKSAMPAVESLAIEGYDTLAASQIVSRLDGLTAPERAAVAQFEAGNRKRKTILDKIGRLDASGGS